MLIGDNFVQPALVGGTARLPFLLALIGIFGGLRAFGLIGLFLGPVIMTALVTVVREADGRDVIAPTGRVRAGILGRIACRSRAGSRPARASVI